MVRPTMTSHFKGDHPEAGFRGNGMQLDKRYVWLWSGVFSILGVLIIAAEAMDPDRTRWLLSEGGLVESVSAAGYFACALVFGLRSRGDWPAKGWYVFAILLIFGLRELDFHSRFTTMGIFKSRFYVSPQVPYIEKGIGAVVLLTLLGAMMILVRRHFRSFLNGIRHLAPAATSLLLAMVLLFFTKSIDGLPRKLSDLGISSTEAIGHLFTAIEEVLEMGIPFLMLLAIWAHYSEGGRPAMTTKETAS